MSHSDLLTPNQLGLTISTSDVTRYDGGTFAILSPVANPSLNNVLTSIDVKVLDLQDQITAIATPVSKTSEISIYDGVPTFVCFSFVGATLNDIIDELGLQICVNATSIGALDTTDISTGGATPTFNASPYPVGAAATNTDEALIAIDAAIQTFDTDKMDVLDVIEILDGGFDSFIISGLPPTPGVGAFDVDFKATIFYRAGSAILPGGAETAGAVTIVVPATKDNYIDYDLIGNAYVITSVANGALEPVVALEHVRATLVITDAIGITSIVNIADTASISSDNLKRNAVDSQHIRDGILPSTKLVTSGVVAATYPFANITVTDRGIVTVASSEVTFTGLADEEFLQFDSGLSKWINVPLIGAILPAGASDQDVLTFQTSTSTWIAQAPIAFTAIPLAGTGAPITGDLEFIAASSIFANTSIITFNLNDITIDGTAFNVTSTNSQIDALTTFTANMTLQNSVAPGVPLVNSIIMYADDRAAIAGTSSLNFLLEDGTVHIIGDIVGFGTILPDASAAVEISSTTGGLRVPNMTTAQRDAISAPAEGLIIYNLTTNQFNGRNNANWVNL